MLPAIVTPTVCPARCALLHGILVAVREDARTVAAVGSGHRPLMISGCTPRRGRGWYSSMLFSPVTELMYGRIGTGRVAGVT